MVKLECPHCHCTLDIKEWNKNVKYSIKLGVCRELIPEINSLEEWDKYKEEEQGRVDCPECGDVACYTDMYAY